MYRFVVAVRALVALACAFCRVAFSLLDLFILFGLQKMPRNVGEQIKQLKAR